MTERNQINSGNLSPQEGVELGIGFRDEPVVVDIVVTLCLCGNWKGSQLLLVSTHSDVSFGTLRSPSRFVTS